jgi:hypothetical protein
VLAFGVEICRGPEVDRYRSATLRRSAERTPMRAKALRLDANRF